MKLSRDVKFLIVVLVLSCALLIFIGPRNTMPDDSASSCSAGKNGMKAAYLGLESSGYRVGRQIGALTKIPKDARVMISAGSPPRLGKNDVRALTDWVKRGNTLILMDSPAQFGLSMEFDFLPDMETRPPSWPKKVAPAWTKYSEGVGRVEVYPPAFIYPSPDDMMIVKDGQGVVISEHRTGGGSVILIADPAMFANSGVGTEDNFVLFTNLVHEHLGRGDGVLFAEWDRILAARAGEKQTPLLGRTERIVFAELFLVLMVVLIGSARRFGSIHPLPEVAEQRRGAEFVQAMAGLYRRFQAREAAIGAIYRSFRREMSLRFGVPPSSAASEAVKAVLLARPVDGEAFGALLRRCDSIVEGKVAVTDGEAAQLTRTIEGFRRELGIARSTED